MADKDNVKLHSCKFAFHDHITIALLKRWPC